MSSSQRHGVLAAGGQKGFISFYPTSVGSVKPEVGSSTALEDRIAEPMLSVKAHMRWISEVQFLSSDNAEHRPLLLSAADDRSVVLSEFSLNDGASSSLKPLCRLDGVHQGGVFSMHEQSDQIVTCAKDSTVVLSTVTETLDAHSYCFLSLKNTLHDAHLSALDSSSPLTMNAGRLNRFVHSMILPTAF